MWNGNPRGVLRLSLAPRPAFRISSVPESGRSPPSYTSCLSLPLSPCPDSVCLCLLALPWSASTCLLLLPWSASVSLSCLGLPLSPPPALVCLCLLGLPLSAPSSFSSL
ncbi:hypothetical protein Pmani_014284 [Petrolisthes manimaculis]|uniref:Uncharacterized protein n=1 Tax=Petrolisthes manimaculis TaxID=1843537 RepID=A0AAE1PTW1_9EUCA|nr:hypothetical protein Pmani_014284 [Petrolisthes manimaculis]